MRAGGWLAAAALVLAGGCRDVEATAVEDVSEPVAASKSWGFTQKVPGQGMAKAQCARIPGGVNHFQMLSFGDVPDVVNFTPSPMAYADLLEPSHVRFQADGQEIVFDCRAHQITLQLSELSGLTVPAVHLRPVTVEMRYPADNATGLTRTLTHDGEVVDIWPPSHRA